MRLCVFIDGVCANCGATKINPRQVCHSRGLGDIVAAGLSAVGITKERVSAIVGGDCGCHERQEALNKWGRKFGIGGPLDQPPASAD